MINIQLVAKILGVHSVRSFPLSHFTIDSRDVKPGGLFFALEGEKVDGHNFLGDVAKSGAFAAVVKKGYVGPDYGLELLFVDDVLHSLQQLAKGILEKRQVKVVGITGSVGKTTVKEFAHHLIAKKFRVHKNFGSRNSQRSLPLEILNSSGDEEVLILEMSMTEKGHIKNLVSIAPPDIVILTRIVLCHATSFEGLEEIAEAKAEIFTDKTEFAVIHENSAKFPAVREMCPMNYVLYPTHIPIPSPFTETHMTENFIGAAEFASYMGLTWQEIELQSKTLKTFPRRFTKRHHRGMTIVDDTYNANPTSMIAALQNLPKPKLGSKTIAVLGSMKELGKFCLLSHKQVAEEALSRVDSLYCYGIEAIPMVELFHKRGKPATFFTSKEEMKTALWNAAKEGDVVLVKGSNSHALWDLLDSL